MLVPFQKLDYDCPTQYLVQTVRNFVLESDFFVMLPTGRGKSLLRFPYIFNIFVAACWRGGMHAFATTTQTAAILSIFPDIVVNAK